MNPIGAVNALYPMPTTLVGATVNGQPNFLTIAHVGILNHGTPQYLSIGLGKVHYSNAGIFENKSFSICLPSED
ncbi:MAG: flavin reductase family protein, partial [Desulfobacterales bacterium]